MEYHHSIAKVTRDNEIKTHKWAVEHQQAEEKIANMPVLRVRSEISSQIFGVEVPGWQGAKVQAYREYSELSQHSQAGCIGD